MSAFTKIIVYSFLTNIGSLNGAVAQPIIENITNVTANIVIFFGMDSLPFLLRPAALINVKFNNKNR